MTLVSMASRLARRAFVISNARRLSFTAWNMDARGSAGVALAGWRLGNGARAREIMLGLERARLPRGGLPDLTQAVPFEFENAPSVAGTAWVELVRFEMERGEQQQWLWAKK